MSTLKNCVTNGIPSQVFKKYLDLYKTIGFMQKTIDFLDEKYPVYMDLTKKDDIFNFYKAFFSDSKLKDSRINQFIEKKTGDYTRNKDEIVLKNIVYIFDLINLGTKLNIDIEEFRNLSNQFLKGTKEVNRFKKNLKNQESYIDRLNRICAEYNNAIKNEDIELIYAACSLLVDFTYLKPFEYYNEEIGIIMFYAILKSADIKSFKYYSFFKALYENKEMYNQSLFMSYHLIDQNLNNCFELLKYMLNICISSYDEISNIENNISYDKQLKKNETVEAVIYKLPVNFSKSDIMAKLPSVSMTTIDRCLKRLSEEGKITSWGKGRNAKWVRIDKTHDDAINFLDNE